MHDGKKLPSFYAAPIDENKAENGQTTISFYKVASQIAKEDFSKTNCLS